MSLILIILIIAIIVVAYSKTVQRYILYYIMKWISKKAAQRMTGDFGSSSQSNGRNGYHGETDNTSSTSPSSKSKMSIKDIMKKRFGQKKQSQYVDYEEIK